MNNYHKLAIKFSDKANKAKKIEVIRLNESKFILYLRKAAYSGSPEAQFECNSGF
jgi:hypothetical protein